MLSTIADIELITYKSQVEIESRFSDNLLIGHRTHVPTIKFAVTIAGWVDAGHR